MDIWEQLMNLKSFEQVWQDHSKNWLRKKNYAGQLESSQLKDLFTTVNEDNVNSNIEV